ncbi:PREDICTED: lysozyme C, milk isozyme-like, partial [Gekko japonicus]|uniref:Lysozyme C, milk isozyme-like n=1 Tax=Gekko japonicus TaxID=146911 RepID=A0ABM1KJ95_GEKJA
WFGKPSFAVTEVWVIKWSEGTQAKLHITLQRAAAMKFQILAALFFLLLAVNEAKVYQKCELVRILRDEGLDDYYGYSLGNWICMAYHESRYNSRAVGRPNSDGSIDYGIFQINSRWWCSNGKGRTANGCRKSCSSFENDDIRDDIECAKRIVRDPNRMGAWVAWRKNCEGRNLAEWTAGC